MAALAPFAVKYSGGTLARRRAGAGGTAAGKVGRGEAPLRMGRDRFRCCGPCKDQFIERVTAGPSAPPHLEHIAAQIESSTFSGFQVSASLVIAACPAQGDEMGRRRWCGSGVAERPRCGVTVNANGRP